MFGKSENRDDYQSTTRPVAAMARDLPGRFHIPRHRHRRAQLLYGCSGVITVTTDQGSWVIPSCRAVWIPASTSHAMTTSGRVEMRTVYIEELSFGRLPERCCAVEVSPLLRDLILAAVAIPNDYTSGGRDERLMTLLVDEIRPAPAMPLHLPMPSDPRALAICNVIARNPGLNASLASLGRHVGASQRTLERLFPCQTGVTFSAWRQRARILAGMRMLAEGHSISAIAMEPGYDSPGAFSFMFRRAQGVVPSRYFRAYPFDQDATEAPVTRRRQR